MLRDLTLDCPSLQSLHTHTPNLRNFECNSLKLRELDLGFTMLVRLSPPVNITRLKVGFALNDDALATILKNCTELEVLEITSTSFNAPIIAHDKLKSLEISNEEKNAMKALTLNTPKLEKAKICCKNAFPITANLACPKLSVLHIVGCMLSQPCLEELPSSCSQLTSLSMTHYQSPQPVELKLHHPTLMSLSLTGMNLVSLELECAMLQELNAEGCKHLQEKSVLGLSGLPSLKQLALTDIHLDKRDALLFAHIKVTYYTCLW